MKKILLIVSLMLCGIMAMAQTQVTSHVVTAGETLYSISKNYGLTVTDILNANPGLTDMIMAGQTIKIPADSSNPEIKKLSPCKQTHIVQKKETIYGISHLYNITEDELIVANPFLSNGKLKKGMELCIPYSQAEKQVHNQKQAEVIEKAEAKRQESLVKYYDVIKIAVIAPFALDQENKSADAKKAADFYKGILMAADTLKHKGISTEFYTYEEIGSDGTGMTAILNKPMLKNCQLIIGPFKPANVEVVAKFAKENNITVVAPMALKSTGLASNKNLFEVSAPSQDIHSKVFSKFIDTYKGCNIVFANVNDAKNNPEYNTKFKSALDAAGISYISLDMASTTNVVLKDTLNTQKPNVFIPSSGSEAAYTALTNALNTKLGADRANYKIRIFGYPEWQTFLFRHKATSDIYGSTFYTTFFADPSSQKIKSFDAAYNNWFKHPQQKSFPKYGILGYDIAQCFINAIHKNGSNFSAKTIGTYNGLQTSFNFVQRSEDSTPYNNSVKFVTYNTDGTYTVK